MQLTLKRRKIGTIHVNKPIFVGDPCYDGCDWLTKTFNLEHGSYTCNVFINNNRNYILQIVLKDEGAERLVAMNKWQECGLVGVDSGMVGVFTEKPDYHDDHKNWLTFCDKIEAENKKHCNREAYIFNEDNLRGFCAYTADGDGEYDVYFIKNKTDNIVAVEVRF